MPYEIIKGIINGFAWVGLLVIMRFIIHFYDPTFTYPIDPVWALPVMGTLSIAIFLTLGRK